MEKRVPVDELAIGMFVTELDRPWVDTPFLLQGFLIQEEETLAQLRSTCAHVIVDLGRSDTSVVGEVRRTQAPARPARGEPKVVRVSAPAMERQATGRSPGWLSRMKAGWKSLTEEMATAAAEREAVAPAARVEPRLAAAPAGGPASAPQPRRTATPARVQVEAPRPPSPPPPPTGHPGGFRLPSAGDLLAWLRDSVAALHPGSGDLPAEPAGPGPADDPSQSATVRIYETTAPLEQELVPATEKFTRASEVLHNVIRDIRAGKGLEIEAVEGVVEDLVESMIRNPDALQLVSSLRETDASAYTHALQLAVLLVAFGRELGFAKTDLQHLGQVGMLLDIGKLRVSREILDKRGNLTTLEFAAVKQHVEHGLEMIRSARSAHPDVVNAIAQHHERINGSGYPLGLRGDDICAFAQMAGIVDTFAALTSPRPHAAAIPPYDAMRNLQAWSETSFRGALVQQFIQAIGIFPVGSLVELSTGEAAIVVGQHKSHRLKPRLLIITGPDKSPLSVPASLDLLYAQGNGAASAPYILRGLPVDGSGIDPAEYYLSR